MCKFQDVLKLPPFTDFLSILKDRSIILMNFSIIKTLFGFGEINARSLGLLEHVITVPKVTVKMNKSYLRCLMNLFALTPPSVSSS